jgi:hypothetical protein
MRVMFKFGQVCAAGNISHGSALRSVYFYPFIQVAIEHKTTTAKSLLDERFLFACWVYAELVRLFYR